MKSWIMSALLTYAVLYILGWAQFPLMPRMEQHEKFIGSAKLGFSNDYWLVKGASLVTAQDRVALFMGYANDFEACRDAAKLLNEKYPEAEYRCDRAN